MAPARTAVEILRFRPDSTRGAPMFEALRRTAAAAGVDVVSTDSYQGGSDLLMLWGPGAPDRFGPMRRHVAAGGHVVCWDGAYWARDTKLRLSIDAAHPQAWVMRKNRSMDRLEADRVRIGSAWDPCGPVVVAGLGRKALAQYGAAVILFWEASMIRACRARGLDVRYRRKRPESLVPDGVVLTSDRPIDQAIDGAAAVITWHSNVAVDAIRLGIPVVCRDGAAAAVCPSTLPDEFEPLSVETRGQFLANLAWFQWAPNEAAACWAFLTELLS